MMSISYVAMAPDSCVRDRIALRDVSGVRITTEHRGASYYDIGHLTTFIKPTSTYSDTRCKDMSRAMSPLRAHGAPSEHRRRPPTPKSPPATLNRASLSC